MKKTLQSGASLNGKLFIQCVH